MKGAFRAASVMNGGSPTGGDAANRGKLALPDRPPVRFRGPFSVFPL